MRVKVHQHTNESGQLVDRLSRNIIVHEFTVTVWDDSDHAIIAAEPLYKWEHSDAGQWVMEHAVEKPVFTSTTEWAILAYRYIVRARLYEEDITFYQLKWGNK